MNVAIVGRPNVGKSSLFNAMLKKRVAVVHDIPGVTRDRLSKRLSIKDISFNLVDTGGYETNDARFSEHINTQIDIALSQADLILFMVDAKFGLNPLDFDIADKLRGIEDKVIVLANKVDNDKILYSDFAQLGFGEPLAISVSHRKGIDELKDRVYNYLKGLGIDATQSNDKLVRVAIAGRPNTGKSTLLNSIIGENRVVTSPVAGTTRDVVDVEVDTKYGRFLFLDTAGIRRHAKIESNIEYYSIERTKKALTNSDVALLIVDGAEGITKQDKNVASIIASAGVACVVVINKYDLMDKGIEKEEFRWKMPHLHYADFVHISALRDNHFNKVFKRIREAYTERTKKISTSKLNQFLHEMLEHHTPPMVSTKTIKLKYMVQVGKSGGAPMFLVFANYPKDIPESYKRYLINGLRERFSFKANPIKLIFREAK